MESSTASVASSVRVPHAAFQCAEVPQVVPSWVAWPETGTAWSSCACGNYLQEMLTYMDSYCQGMRAWQQQWVSLVETACRSVLEADFKEMVLVGSLALSLETPGSDVDIVCMTHSQQVDAVTVLRKVRDILTSDSHASGFPENFGAVVIDEARIPILSITSENQVLVDLAINSHHSIEHAARNGPGGTSAGVDSDIALPQVVAQDATDPADERWCTAHGGLDVTGYAFLRRTER